MCTFKMGFLQRPLGFFCMIAHGCYEYEAFRFATHVKKKGLP